MNLPILFNLVFRKTRRSFSGFSLWFFVFVGLAFSYLKAQHTPVSLPFSSATAFLEPDGRQWSMALNEKEYVLLSKKKGGLQGDAEYSIEKYTKPLSLDYSIPLTVKAGEEPLRFWKNTKALYLLATRYTDKSSQLVAYEFDLGTGSQRSEVTLANVEVKANQEVSGKASPLLQLKEQVALALEPGAVVPYTHGFHAEQSPDQKSLLVYWYDFSQKNLRAHCWLLNESLLLQKQATLPIDGGFLNVGFYPSNAGEIYVLNTDRSGRVVMIWINLETMDNRLLDIQSASSQRHSLRIQIWGNRIVYLAAIQVPMGQKSMQGVLYARFDFDQMVIEKINLHDISQNMQQTASSMRGRGSLNLPEENWAHFSITHFSVNEFEKIILVLEKSFLETPGFPYQGQCEWKPSLAQIKTGRVHSESMLLFSFNKDDELLWENYLVKSQVNDISAGLELSSHCLQVADQGLVRVLYSYSSSASSLPTEISLTEFDELTGMRQREISLSPEGGWSMMSGYTQWWEDGLSIACRKGLLGKKSALFFYSLK
ncbi:MAG: hypothetical protein MUF42_02300 [Cytophagaceae bacterium]|jgi:hypothetical protein|nr:hypothetical protein [Cytophagaceae bacterium]